MLAVGTQAPNFALTNQNGDKIELSSFKGKKVVLYFYPKDNTSGCTKQACSFSERIPSFDDENTIVLGISKDSVKSHFSFSEKYNLKFNILSDETKEVINLYDVWKEKIMYGKSTFGVVRTTYLIDENGIIIYAKEKVNSSENAQEMLSLIKGEK